jgi:hypothetical protein
MQRGVCFAASIVILLGTDSVRAQPVVTRVAPAAVQPGASVDWTIHGTKLDDPIQVWTSFSAQLETTPVTEKEVTSRACKVTVPADTVVGIGGIVVTTSEGVSAVQLVMIDDLPSTPEGDDNHSVETAQILAFPAAVDAVASGPQSDYFRFDAKQGQRIAVELVAARIGSIMDPVARLLDAKGRELVFADDDESLGADCRFEHTFAAAGTFVIEVRDNRFRGDGPYRLRLGDFPLVSVPYPLGGRFGSTARFQFAGLAADGIEPVILRLPAEARAGQLSIAARFPNGQSSTMARLAASTLPESTEVEPNDSIKVATPVTLPCALNGRFAERGDKDCFAFPATKDQRMEFRAVSRSLGAPSLLFLQLVDANGKQLVESTVNDSDDFTIRYTFPADGMYCLSVRDLLKRGGADFAYRVEAELDPGFRLQLKNDKDAAFSQAATVANGAVPLNLTVDRQGYDGPIDLAWESDDVPLRLIKRTIPAKAKEHQVVAVMPPDGQLNQMFVARLVGRAVEQQHAGVQLVDTTAVVRARQPQIAHVPAWLPGLIFIGCKSAADPFFELKIEQTAVQFDREPGQVTVKSVLERKDKEFKENATLDLRGLPTGFSWNVKQDKDQYDLVIVGPKDAPASSMPLHLVAYGHFKGRGQVVRHKIQLDIPSP